MSKVIAHLRAQWMGAVALIIALGTGTAYAANTIGTDDIINGQVKSVDIGNHQVQGVDVRNETLSGADIDENTLDIGNAARAYARVPVGCTGACSIDRAKGISSVTRFGEGRYCVVAPGIDPLQTAAVASVEWSTTSSPEGNASAMVAPGSDCGGGFVVYTYFGPNVDVFDTAGNVRTVRGSSTFSDSVGFTIVIP